jgi:hypothetical protein
MGNLLPNEAFMMLLTTEQRQGLVNEALRSDKYLQMDDLFLMKDYIYNHYAGYLTIKNNAWYISFEEPKWRTLFLIKHP